MVGFLSPTPSVESPTSWSSSPSDLGDAEANDGTNSIALTFSLMSFCCRSLALESVNSASSQESGAVLLDMIINQSVSPVYTCTDDDDATTESPHRETSNDRRGRVDKKKRVSDCGTKKKGNYRITRYGHTVRYKHSAVLSHWKMVAPRVTTCSAANTSARSVTITFLVCQ